MAKRKSTSTKKRAGAPKTTTRKTAAAKPKRKPATAKKARPAAKAAKPKAAARKTAAKKTTPKKAAPKKVAPKKSPPKKAAAKRAVRAAARPTAKKVAHKVAAAAKVKPLAARRPGVAPKAAAEARAPLSVQPKAPRRTKQALPPRTAPVPPPVVDVEAVAAPARVPGPTCEAGAAPAAGQPGESAPVESVAPPQTLAVGAVAPEFTLLDETGTPHTLSQYRGRQVVLYFYPKDDTPGCTTEACGFRNRLGDFTTRDAVVLGVSPDPVDSHAHFARKYGLTFPLLADADHVTAQAFGVWVQKQQMGRTYWGVVRTTYIIDREGRVAEVFRNVRPDGHEQEVLSRLTP